MFMRDCLSSFLFCTVLCGAGIKIMLALYNNMFPPLLYSGGECVSFLKSLVEFSSEIT